MSAARSWSGHFLLIRCWHLSASLESDTKTVIKAITEINLEGVIAKRRTSCYETGKRTGDWIKHRLHSRQEFVIGGFTPRPHAIGAIAVGYYEGDRLTSSHAHATVSCRRVVADSSSTSS